MSSAKYKYGVMLCFSIIQHALNWVMKYIIVLTVVVVVVDCRVHGQVNDIRCETPMGLLCLLRCCCCCYCL